MSISDNVGTLSGGGTLVPVFDDSISRVPSDSNLQILCLLQDGTMEIGRKSFRYGYLGKYQRIKDTDYLLGGKCSICLEDYTVGEYKRNLSCKHTFHKRCVDKWFKKSGERFCPICRRRHNYLLC